MSNLNKSNEMIEKEVDKKVDEGERKVLKQYALLLNDIRRTLASVYEKFEQNGSLTFSEMAKYNRLQALTKQINHLLNTHYKNIKDVVYDVLGESYLDGYYITAWAVETDTLSKLSYSSVSKETINAMIENPISGLTLSERLEKHRVDIIYKIKQEVTQGLIKGETYGTMANRVKDALEGDVTKAVRVVRTESHRSVEAGKHDSAEHAQKNGVIMSKEWNSMQDERVRPGRGIGKKSSRTGANHRMLDGITIPIDQNFKGKLGSGPAPGQLGHAGEDINCRCFLTYTVESIKKPNAKELENMAFETWKKERLKSSSEVK
ncbi:hypothetical protein HV436_06575 [Bacillus sporothermodurans]|uniref:Phage head morphogenesis domain-containing protein n=3 Tax=Heyndrickxia sporothermodurans TaxID=46224 RepID=A0AB37HEQ1_9BACI|nr:phage minor head protein [Heyndrickxia sporothermodurans]MBL5768408.1 hypothetical protein [Heyndrickxia sporothermodurans]MBL5771027.1 hypothetical protein [Heyndrickxia sporothermodurans]MBL5774677.1 hypothetical protein [Heyndrickxia sporothermodurans]MBL5778129.1 hypothetical protein [Heyndrickxia sporothermodurans]MBL5785402.1 hypothetical protein [Heyndrickxia sporothermodurans]